MIIIKSECAIAGRRKIISSDTAPWIPLAVDRREVAILVLQYEDGTLARSIQHNVVQLSAVVVVECKSPICRRLQIIPSDALSGIPLMVDRREGTIFVFQDPKRASAGSIEHDVIQLPTVIIVECE